MLKVFNPRGTDRWEVIEREKKKNPSEM